MPKAHHPTMPPSAWPALLKCPKFKSSPEMSNAATAGSLQHDFIANFFSPTPAGDGSDKFNLNIEEGVQCLWAIDQIKDFIKGNILSEYEVVCTDDDTFEEITHGTADAVSEKGDVLIDYKSGDFRDYRPQLTAYALGLMQRLGSPSVTCYELYGRSRHIEKYEIQYGPALDLARKVRGLVYDSAAKPSACDYCKWCSNATVCPEVQSKAIAVADGYKKMTFKSWHPSEITDPGTMSNMLALADIVTDWAESVKFHAKSQALGGNIPIGYKLRERKGKRTISDIQACFEGSRLPPDKFLKCCTVSLTQLKDGLNLKQTEFNRFINQYAVVGKSSMDLVKDKSNAIPEIGDAE